MKAIEFKLVYEWQPVFLRESVEYQFPMAISPYMRSKYRIPAVFKWDVYQNTPGDKKLIYIGEAQELCPQRLYGYLNPGQTQLANKKINTDFRGYLKEKLGIRLEICHIQEIVFDGSIIDPGGFTDKHLRRLASEALIVEHRKNGFTVVDL